MAGSIDQRHKTGIIITSSIVMGIIILTVTLRFISRKFVVKKLRADDWLMLIAVMFTCMFCTTFIIACSQGLGLHVQDIDLDRVSILLKMVMILENSYLCSTYFIKLSILAFYLHIFLPESWPRRIILCTNIFLTLYTLSTVLVLVFKCSPVPRAWDPNIPGTCINLEVFIYYGAVVNISTDLIIFILPIQTVWQMQRTKSEKHLLGGLFSLSLMACIMGCVRISTVSRYFVSKDFSWNLFELSVWSMIEIATGILCGSAPALKPLFFHGPRRESDTMPVLEKNGRNGELVECKRWKINDYIYLVPGNFQKAKTAERVETMNTTNRIG